MSESKSAVNPIPIDRKRAEQAREKRICAILFCVQLLMMTEFLMIMPLSLDIIGKFGLTTAEYSAVIAVRAFFTSFSALSGSYLFGRFRKKNLLIGFMGGLALSIWICLFAPTFLIFCIGRIFGGMCGGVLLALTFTIVRAEIGPGQRAATVGLLNAANQCASAAGIPLLLFLSNWGWNPPYATIAVVTTLTFVACFYLPAETAYQERVSLGKTLLQLKKAATDIRYLPALASNMFIIISNLVFAPYYSAYLVYNCGVRENLLALYYFVAGGSAALVSLGIGLLSDIYGPKRAFLASVIASVLPIVIFSAMSSNTGIFAMVAFTGIVVMSSWRQVASMTAMLDVATASMTPTLLSANAFLIQFAQMTAVSVGGALLTKRPDGGLDHMPLIAEVSIGVSILAAVLISHSNKAKELEQSQIDALFEAANR